MVVPDYQMLEYVERIASHLSNDPVLYCFINEFSLLEYLRLVLLSSHELLTQFFIISNSFVSTKNPIDQGKNT